MNEFMRIDKEVKTLVKQYIKVLFKEQGIKYTQAEATKLALRKVLK